MSSERPFWGMTLKSFSNESRQVRRDLQRLSDDLRKNGTNEDFADQLERRVADNIIEMQQLENKLHTQG